MKNIFGCDVADKKNPIAHGDIFIKNSISQEFKNHLDEFEQNVSLLGKIQSPIILTNITNCFGFGHSNMYTRIFQCFH